MEHYCDFYTFSGNGIETFGDLDAYRIYADGEIQELKATRDWLRNKLKRVMRKGEEAEILEVKKEIASVSEKVRKLKDKDQYG